MSNTISRQSNKKYTKNGKYMVKKLVYFGLGLGLVRFNVPLDT